MPMHERQRPTAEVGGAEWAVTVLGADHARFERIFDTLGREAQSSDPLDFQVTWSAFARELVAHLDAEELHILGPFTEAEPDVGRDLLDEHGRIRRKLSELGIDLELHSLEAERIETFINELRAHAIHEERLLYPWARRKLGPVACERLLRALAVSKRVAHNEPKGG
jgi:hemerythrin superfamily protein